jgi:Fic family protein
MLNVADWIRLGEVLSTCDHIAGVPLAPAAADELHKIYLVKGIHASAQIEGNSLSEDEVRARVEGALSLPESQEYLGKEIDNIHAACNLVCTDIFNSEDLRLTTKRIMTFNEMVLDELPEQDGVIPGQIRTKGVAVGGIYVGAPAGDCEYLLDQLCEWLEQMLQDAGPEWRRPVSVIRAILAHLYLAWIHPFGDGNGRTARLIEFQLLLAAGFPTPACHVLSNYYNKTRSRYYQVLRETSQAEGYPAWRFATYAIQGFIEELRDQIEVIQSHQRGLTWVNFVHSAELGTSRPTIHRRRALILALPHDSPADVTPISAIPRLTPELAELYAGMTPKAVTRDVNCLEQVGLLVREGRLVRPRLETLFAFLPLRKKTQVSGEADASIP